MEKENRFSEVAIEKKKRINFFWQAIQWLVQWNVRHWKIKNINIEMYIYVYIKKRMLFNWWNTYEHAESKNFNNSLNTLKCYKWIVEMHKNTFTWLCIVHSTF